MDYTIMPSCASLTPYLLSSKPMNPNAAIKSSGVGIDLVEVDRFRTSLETGGEKMLNKLFTAHEQASCNSRKDPILHYAARFAAKEAAMKALGTGWTKGVAFTDFEIESDGATTPTLRIKGQAATIAEEHGIENWSLSITHTEKTAGAIVIAGFQGDSAANQPKEKSLP